MIFKFIILFRYRTFRGIKIARHKKQKIYGHFSPWQLW